MPRYFLDTSALAKLYRPELGSEVMNRIVADPVSRAFISLFVVLEIESVLELKMRTREIDSREVGTIRRRFEDDLFRRNLIVAEITEDNFVKARNLLLQYGQQEALRAPDALHLSVASGLRDAGFVSVFVTADQKLARVAALEGFATLNPEQPLVP